MKLLFDHNLSHRLVNRLQDVFPNSSQTRLLNFGEADDIEIWRYAKNNDFAIVTLDKDFADLSFLRGSPPKIIWLRCVNSTVIEVEQLLRANLLAIQTFQTRPDQDILEIWP